ncbi:Inositol-pentakisphosphate 2-kinase [Lignoscripta atroalba]|nr:Inositol-pentakisphosphate 2-kinase [Lignoscripta atroalba]
MKIIDLSQDVGVQYLAEGAANVVYKFIFPPPSPSISSDFLSDGDQYGSGTPLPSDLPPLHSDPVLQEKLLRLRKDIPTRVPVIEAQQNFEDLIKHYFTERDLVDQVVVRLPPGLIHRCNRELRSMEVARTRPTMRHGVSLAEQEEYGTLIMDMSSKGEEDLACIEFKPKWLAQSPSAPAGAKRCRTCALRVMKMARTGDHATSDIDVVFQDSFCPLDLISNDKLRVTAAVDAVLQGPGLSNSKNKALRSRVVDFLRQSPLLPRLRQLQLELDPKGVFADDASKQDFLTAMTLRDCTLFLRVCYNKAVTRDLMLT